MSTLSNVETGRDQANPPSVRVAPETLPEAISSQTGVSVRYVPVPDKRWYVLRASYGREQKAFDYIVNDGTFVYIAKRYAHKIVNGQPIDYTVKDKDFFFFQRLEYHGLQELVVSLCKERLPKAYGLSPMTDIQVISPTRQGPAGTVELNKIMQQQLNPRAAGKSEIKTPVYTYRAGDKVMQTKNDYEILWKRQTDDEHTESGTGIFNGDIGIIKSVNSILKTAVIDFEGRTAVYSLPMLDNLELAYAVTVHKSQGSEFEVVILTAFGGYDKLYYRNLLYTAVTRARKMLIIVGSSKRVDYMIANDRRNLRYTVLKDLLVEMVAEDDEE